MPKRAAILRHQPRGRCRNTSGIHDTRTLVKPEQHLRASGRNFCCTDTPNPLSGSVHPCMATLASRLGAANPSETRYGSTVQNTFTPTSNNQVRQRLPRYFPEWRDDRVCKLDVRQNGRDAGARLATKLNMKEVPCLHPLPTKARLHGEIFIDTVRTCQWHVA